MLHKCQGCGHLVDDSAPYCPKCGREKPTESDFDKIVFAALPIIIIIIFVILGSCYSH